MEGSEKENRSERQPVSLDRVLASEHIYIEKDKDPEPHGGSYIQGVESNELTADDNVRIARAISALAEYTGAIIVKDYFEQRHEGEGGRKEWRQRMRTLLQGDQELLEQFLSTLTRDKMRNGTMDRCVLRSIDDFEIVLSAHGLHTDQTMKFDEIVREVPQAVTEHFYYRLKDEDKRKVVEKMDEIARRLLRLFAPVEH